MKSKKGQGLPMNTIILAIIVIIVLVIIVVFFLGGTSSIAQKIKDIFLGATAGQDKELAVQFCNQYCDRGNEVAWCGHIFKVDTDGDGAAEKNQETGNYYKWYCGTPVDPLLKQDEDSRSLGMSCPNIGTCSAM